MFSQVSVRPHGGGGYPSPRFFPRSLVPGPFLGVHQDGVPPSQGWVPPQPGMGHPRSQGWGTPNPHPGVPQPVMGIPPGRTAERVLAMRRALCLLSSRRRAFLFTIFLCTITTWMDENVKKKQDVNFNSFKTHPQRAR